jgi:hypothetical protein
VNLFTCKSRVKRVNAGIKYGHGDPLTAHTIKRPEVKDFQQIKIPEGTFRRVELGHLFAIPKRIDAHHTQRLILDLGLNQRANMT